MLGAVLLGIVAVYRTNNCAPRISLFIFYTNGGAVLNYTLVLQGAVPIDPLLIRVDVALGFDWARFA